MVGGDGRSRRRLEVPEEAAHYEGTSHVWTGSPLSTCTR
jgi:hypothetical protein